MKKFSKAFNFLFLILICCFFLFCFSFLFASGRPETSSLSDRNLIDEKYDIETGRYYQYYSNNDICWFIKDNFGRTTEVYEEQSKADGIKHFSHKIIDPKYGIELYSDNDGNERWNTIDAFGNLTYSKIRLKESVEKECFPSYYDDGKLKQIIVSNGKEKWFSYIANYNERGDITYIKEDDSPGVDYFADEDSCLETWYEYNSDGNMSHVKVVSCADGKIVYEEWLEKQDFDK